MKYATSVGPNSKNTGDCCRTTFRANRGRIFQLYVSICLDTFSFVKIQCEDGVTLCLAYPSTLGKRPHDEAKRALLWTPTGFEARDERWGRQAETQRQIEEPFEGSLGRDRQTAGSKVGASSGRRRRLSTQAHTRLARLINAPTRLTVTLQHARNVFRANNHDTWTVDSARAWM